jgi:hypothetical protein
MAYHHTVLFRWSPETPAGHAEAVQTALLAMAETLSGCRSYACGPRAEGMPNAHDFGVMAVFDDKSGWDAYQADPEHGRIRDEMIAPFIADRATFQLELDR